MNATKPQPARSVPNQKPAPVQTASANRRREAEAAKAAPTDTTEPAEGDFERHDTIPAPTWFDDGSEASSS